MKGREKYYVLNVSGGKDSTALFLEWFKRHQEDPENYPLNEVITIDLGKDFPVAYEVVDMIRQKCENAGIKFTKIVPPISWDELMYETKKSPFKIKKYAHINVLGRSWPTGKVRWCTGELKKDVTKAHYKELEEKYDVYQLIGIAADEALRLGTKTAEENHQLHPLADWGWTEKDCLQYCYDNGVDWGGYYETMDRLSCFCCPMKNYKELRLMRKNYPEVWATLRDMDDRTWHSFKDGCSVRDIEKRFDLEEEFLAKGESITSRKFYNALRERVPWFNVDLPCGFKPEFLQKADPELYNEFMQELQETKDKREERARIAEENKEKRKSKKQRALEQSQAK